MRPKVLLNTYRRTIEQVSSAPDYARIQSIADLVWARDQELPESAVEEARENLVATVTMRWCFGDVRRFPKLKAILESGGRFFAPLLLD